MLKSRLVIPLIADSALQLSESSPETLSIRRRECPVIPDRMIEDGTLRTDGGRTSVEVRIPWYRALPASCIADVGLTVDGASAPKETLRWTMNGRDFRLEELPERTDEWWFPTDSAVVSAELPVSAEREHDVEVELRLYIPYIVTDHGVLLIEEHGRRTMTAVEHG
jgi:hypothetical protein